LEKAWLPSDPDGLPSAASVALRSRLLAVGLLALAFALALTSAVQKSPTMDEQNHIARGAAYLGTGDPRLSIEHPPLVNVLSALPAHLLLDLHLPLDEWWDASEWYHFAESFLWQVNSDPDRIVFLARLPIIGMGLVLAALAFRWAESMWGPGAGLLATAFCALDPNVLAHTRFSTTDVGGACLAFLAVYAMWWATRHRNGAVAKSGRHQNSAIVEMVWRRSWARACASGLALGLALSAKLSNLLLLPILALTILIDALADRRAPFSLQRRHSDGAPSPLQMRHHPYKGAIPMARHRNGASPLRRLGRNLALLAFATVIGLLTVWACYGFQLGRLDPGGPLVPAPPYLRGILAILSSSSAGRPAYLLGQYGEGWWYYFPVAFAVKTPLATLVALLLATGKALGRGNRRARRQRPDSSPQPAAGPSARTARRPRPALADEVWLLTPPVVYFLATMTSSLNIGYRHLLPMLPFLAVHVGRLAAPTLLERRHSDGAPLQHPTDRRHPAGIPPSTLQPPTSNSGRPKTLAHRLVPVVLALWLALASASIYPHFLAFFNPIGGGPENGWHIIVDSNIDWGQDMKGLKAWIAQEGIDHVRLSWFGSAHPEAYGIPHDLLPGLPHGFLTWEQPPFDRESPEPGIYVISVTNLIGVHFPNHDLYGWFRARPPDAKIGYSLFVYEVLSDG